MATSPPYDVVAISFFEPMKIEWAWRIFIFSSPSWIPEQDEEKYPLIVSLDHVYSNEIVLAHFCRVFRDLLQLSANSDVNEKLSDC